MLRNKEYTKEKNINERLLSMDSTNNNYMYNTTNQYTRQNDTPPTAAATTTQEKNLPIDQPKKRNLQSGWRANEFCKLSTFFL